MIMTSMAKATTIDNIIATATANTIHHPRHRCKHRHRHRSGVLDPVSGRKDVRMQWLTLVMLPTCLATTDTLWAMMEG